MKYWFDMNQVVDKLIWPVAPAPLEQRGTRCRVPSHVSVLLARQRQPRLATDVRCYRQPVDVRYLLAHSWRCGISTDQNKAAVLRFMEALNSTGDLNVFDEACTRDVAQEWRHNMEGFAFSDRDFTVDDMIAEGAKVAILWTNTGTHTGEYAGIPATGKRSSDKGSAFFTFDGDGKIATVVSYFDAESLFRQLGATISPPT